MIEVPSFNTKKEMFAWLVANKKHLEAAKKMAVKYSDPFIARVAAPVITVQKAATPDQQNISTDLQVKAVINTTNWFDSHYDVHIPGLWTKSLQESKALYHLQEHKMSFANIISDEVKAAAVMYNFRDLGVDIDGQTQALVFDSLVKMDRNKYMYDQYQKGYVKNHSVGMRYVKLVMCVNDEEYGAEYEAWEKYFPQVANKAECGQIGYFWAVTEAKVLEGSAVPIGSNTVTPTLAISSKAAIEALDTEPPAGTQKTTDTQQQTAVNWEAVQNKILLL